MHQSTYAALAVIAASLVVSFPHQEQSIYKRTEVDAVDLTAVIYPDYADPPANSGGWVGCDFGDDDCGCTNAANNLEAYCGFIDPTWSPPTTTRGRRLSEDNGAEDPSVNEDPDIPDDPTYDTPLYDDNSTSTDTTVLAASTLSLVPLSATSTPISRVVPLDPSLTSRDLILAREDPSQEIVARVKLPLIAALSTIGFHYVKDTVTKCIRTKLPKESQGKYVQGLKGTLGRAQSMKNKAGAYVKFTAAAVWEIRWDWSGKNKDGSLPASGILGPHINMVVQEGANRIKWAFYFPEASGFWSLIAGQNTDQGVGGGVSDANSRYAQIVTRITDLAMYVFNPTDPSNSVWHRANDPVTGEVNAAKAIAAAWSGNLDSYNEDHHGLKRRERMEKRG